MCPYLFGLDTMQAIHCNNDVVLFLWDGMADNFHRFGFIPNPNKLRTKHRDRAKNIRHVVSPLMPLLQFIWKLCRANYQQNQCNEIILLVIAHFPYFPS